MTILNSMKTKALVYHGPRKLEWEDWPIKELGSDEVLVKVRAVGICGSDLHGYTGESGRRIPPMVMGHEATGEVVEIGSNARPEWLHHRVIIQPFIACGTCGFCLAGRSNLCRKRKFLGVNITGAMAEYIVVPQSSLVLLPDCLSFESGTLVEPLSVAIHGVARAGEISGLSVLVVGAGPIGLFTMVAARQAGARKVIISDLAKERLELALKMGADGAIDPGNGGIREKMSEIIHTEEVDLAFDAVGLSQTFSQALDTVKPGGLVVALGGWQTLPLNLGPVVAREIEIRGTFNFIDKEFSQAVNWLENKIVDPDMLQLLTFSLRDGARVFEDLSTHPNVATKVILTS
jgi:2-desacetyl-2-hydroxyethyl bacteriochlorophyllide A dehydrogenase